MRLPLLTRAAFFLITWSPDGTKLLVARAVGVGTEFRVYSFDKVAKTLSLIVALDSAVNFNSVDVTPAGGNYYLTGDSNNKVSVFGSFTGLSNGFFLNNIKVTFSGDVVLTNTLWIQGNCAINGAGHNIFLGTSGSIALDSGASLLLDNVNVKNVAGNNIRCLDSLGTLSLNDVALSLDSNFNFTKGHFEITGDVVVTSTNLSNGLAFIYQSDQVSTISFNATFFFDDSTIFRYAPSTSSKTLISLVDPSASLYFKEAALSLTTTGMQLTKGNIFIEGTCPLLSDAIAQNQGLILGDGSSSANNISLKILPESGLLINSGYVVNRNI